MMNLKGEQEWLSLNEYKEKESSLKSQDFHVVGVVVVPASHTEDNTYRIVGVEKIESYEGIFGQEDYDSGYFYLNDNYYSGVALVEHTHNTDDEPAYNAKFDSAQTVIYKDIYELRENNILDYAEKENGWDSFYKTNYNAPTFATDYEADITNDGYNAEEVDVWPIEEIQNPYDTNTFWYTHDYTSFRGDYLQDYDYDPSWAEMWEEHYLMPSPYLNNGLKNELYHSGGFENALSDMNGKENTEIIYQHLSENLNVTQGFFLFYSN